MLSSLLFDLFLFILVLISLSCVFVPFFMAMNDKINDKFKDQWTDPAFGMGAGKKSSYIEYLEPAFLTIAANVIVFSVYN